MQLDIKTVVKKIAFDILNTYFTKGESVREVKIGKD